MTANDIESRGEQDPIKWVRSAICTPVKHKEWSKGWDLPG